jgi:hypothetical protein
LVPVSDLFQVVWFPAYLTNRAKRRDSAAAVAQLVLPQKDVIPRSSAVTPGKAVTRKYRGPAFVPAGQETCLTRRMNLEPDRRELRGIAAERARFLNESQSPLFDMIRLRRKIRGAPAQSRIT